MSVNDQIFFVTRLFKFIYVVYDIGKKFWDSNDVLLLSCKQIVNSFIFNFQGEDIIMYEDMIMTGPTL